MFGFEDLKKLDLIYKEKLKSAKVVGECALDEKQLKDLCRGIGNYSEHLLANTFNHLLIVVSCNIAYYYYNEAGFWTYFFHELQLEETQQLRAELGEKIEKTLEKLNFLNYKRKGPFRYVGAILEQTGITRSNMEAYANLMSFFINTYGIKKASELQHSCYQKIVQNAYISKTLKAYLVDEAGWDFNKYVIKMIDYYTNKSFTIKEIESFKGVHPKFWSEFMKHYKLTNSKYDYNHIFEISPRFMFDTNSMSFYIKFPSKTFTIDNKGILNSNKNITTYIFSDIDELGKLMTGEITLLNGLSYEWSLDTWDYNKDKVIYFNEHGEHQKKISSLRSGKYIVIARSEEEIRYGNVIRNLGKPKIDRLIFFNVFEVKFDGNENTGMYPSISWEQSKSRLEVVCFYDVFISEIPKIKLSNKSNYNMMEFSIFYNIGNGIKKILDTSKLKEFYNEVNKRETVIGEIWIDTLINNRNFHGTKLRFCKIPKCRFVVANGPYMLGEKLSILNDSEFISLNSVLEINNDEHIVCLEDKYIEGKISIEKNIISFERIIEWIDISLNNNSSIKEWYYFTKDNLSINIKGILQGEVVLKLKNEMDETLVSKRINFNENNEYSYSFNNFLENNDMQSFNVLKIIIECSNRVINVEKIIYNAENLINQYYRVINCDNSMKLISKKNQLLFTVLAQVKEIISKNNYSITIVDSSSLIFEIDEMYRTILLYSQEIDETIFICNNKKIELENKFSEDSTFIKPLIWYKEAKLNLKINNKNNIESLISQYQRLELPNLERWKIAFDKLKIELKKQLNKEDIFLGWKKEVESLKRFSLKSEISKMDKGRELSYAWIDYLKGNYAKVFDNLDRSVISKEYIVRDLSYILKIIIYLNSVRITAFNEICLRDFKEDNCNEFIKVYISIANLILKQEIVNSKINYSNLDKFPIDKKDKNLIEAYKILNNINDKSTLVSYSNKILSLMIGDWKIQLLVKQYLKLNKLDIDILSNIDIDEKAIPNSPEIKKILDII